jgi:2,5-diamino-6-(ribosylamino)-4(3H)-pyrimidinone 5'-phosphate reductase
VPAAPASHRPHVVAHVAVSLDGATTGFTPDAEAFYALAATWSEDVTLVGADTILAQEAALTTAPRPGPAEHGPLLVVVDGRGRVREWEALREVGHWSDVLALRCRATPAQPAGRARQELVVGAERVDLAAALDSLRRRGCRTVRVDSGGGLVGALLRAGLLDEVSLLVHPCLSGGASALHWYGDPPPPETRLETISSTACANGLVWLRYRLLGVRRR